MIEGDIELSNILRTKIDEMMENTGEAGADAHLVRLKKKLQTLTHEEHKGPSHQMETAKGISVRELAELGGSEVGSLKELAPKWALPFYLGGFYKEFNLF
jgi:hypothetical protein